MKPPNNIFLVGPMGAGKTTVGRQLAKSLRKEFVDCDKELEDRTGASISLIFELEGEEGFRRRESALLDEIVRRDDIIMATGGGVVLAEGNRALLVSRGYVVYLKAPIDLLVARTAKDRNRPLMQTEDPKARVAELMDRREPLYQQVADTVVTTGRRSSRFVVREILKRLEAL